MAPTRYQSKSKYRKSIELTRNTEKLGEEMDKSKKKMNLVMKKLGDLLKTSDSSSICTVLALIGLFMLMLFLVLFT